VKAPAAAMVERPPTQAAQMKMAPGPAPVVRAALAQAGGPAVAEAKAEVAAAEGASLEGASQKPKRLWSLKKSIFHWEKALVGLLLRSARNFYPIPAALRVTWPAGASVK